MGRLAVGRMEPGGYAGRPLDLIVMVQCSGFMAGELIACVNYAVRGLIEQFAAWERAQHGAQVLVRVITFATTAQWHVASPVPASQVRWAALHAVRSGRSNMAPAFRLAASALAQDRPGRRALRPVLLLITAGPPTDTPADLANGLAALLSAPSGHQARRLALAIGRAAETRFSEAFAGGPDCPVLVARSLDDVPALLLQAGQMISSSHDEQQRGWRASDEREPGEEVI